MQGTTKQSDVTIGLDLGDRRSQAVVLDAGGEEIEKRSVATTSEAFGRAFKEYADSVLVIEVETHSPWVSRLFKGAGLRRDRCQSAAGAAHQREPAQDRPFRCAHAGAPGPGRS